MLKLSAAPRPFCVALSPSVHWHACFLYCCALYIFFLGFRQWRSRADRVVNLNTTIRLALFWRTWTRARAHTRPHVLAWHMGRDYSDSRASELTDRQVSGFVYSWFLENTEKTKALKENFLRLMPRTELRYAFCKTVCFETHSHEDKFWNLWPMPRIQIQKIKKVLKIWEKKHFSPLLCLEV